LHRVTMALHRVTMALHRVTMALHRVTMALHRVTNEFSACLCAYLCVPLRLNFNPQFPTILRNAIRNLRQGK
jgi:hypothetical protein